MMMHRLGKSSNRSGVNILEPTYLGTFPKNVTNRAGSFLVGVEERRPDQIPRDPDHEPSSDHPLIIN